MTGSFAYFDYSSSFAYPNSLIVIFIYYGEKRNTNQINTCLNQLHRCHSPHLHIGIPPPASPQHPPSILSAHLHINTCSWHPSAGDIKPSGSFRIHQDTPGCSRTTCDVTAPPRTPTTTSFAYQEKDRSKRSSPHSSSPSSSYPSQDYVMEYDQYGHHQYRRMLDHRHHYPASPEASADDDSPIDLR